MKVFAEVCVLPERELAGALAALREEDAETHREVERLLAAERHGAGRLDPPSFAGSLPEWNPPDEASGASLTGTRIAQFEVGERIGLGGMGEVYAGVDTVLRRKVALKAIRHDQRMSETARRRFLREAQMLSSLDHPNICRIHDYLRGEELDLLVLEMIDGRSLRKAAEEGIASAEALLIAEQIADALAAAHAKGIIHRDLKLSNVMLTGDGTAKVLDFGLARPVRSGEKDAVALSVTDLTPSAAAAGSYGSLAFETATGLVAGTPSSMSPEQIEGRPASAASDMYSFGLLAQELFTGAPAYDPELTPGELLEAARHASTRTVSGIDRDLAALIDSLTAKQALTRPTASSVVDRLRWIRDKPKRRLRRAAAVALIAIFALLGLKYTLDLWRERTVSDQRRAQAEGLIEFMLGNLRTKLEPLGRLDLLDDVGDKALDYFASVAEAELSDDELLSRAEALTQIGEVRLSQNRYDEALASFEEAYRHSAALVARNPEDGQVLFDRGQAEYWVGYVHWRRLKGVKAQDWLGRYRDTSEALLDLDASRDEWILEAAYSHHNLAVLDLELGDPEAAEAGFLAEIEVFRQLIERNPDDSELVLGLADAFSWLGTAAHRRGLLARASELFGESAARRKALVEEDPENAIQRFWWAQAMVLQGDIEVIRGYCKESVEIYQRSIDILQDLVNTDPTNREWLRALVTVKVAQSEPLAAEEGAGRVRAQLTEATAVLEKLVVDEPADRLSRQTLATAYRMAARLGVSRSALETIARAVEITEGLHAEAPKDLGRLAELATTLVVAGEVQQAAGERDAALASWRRAIELLAEPVDGSSFPDLLAPWARALAAVGRTAESEAAAMSLSDAGFRSVWQWTGSTPGNRKSAGKTIAVLPH